jgi:Protein of unknown function (DUF2844)
MKASRTLLWLIVAAGPCTPALAALGGDAASVEAERAGMKATLRETTTPGGFTVHELEVPGGMLIREYASLDGKVFAVTWHGRGVPDLQKMLGSYYGEFAQAASVPHYPNHHHLSIHTANVVVESHGHTRAFFGRAWAPALVPENFSLGEID